MSDAKRDFLGECNDQGVPLEDFRLAFCVRCFQRDCSRSQFGTSKFEARVNTWQDRLFHAPQLPRTDPRFASITAKRFLTLSAGPTPTVREWIDPQVVDSPPLQAQVRAPEPVVPEPPKQDLLVETPTTEAPQPEVTPREGPRIKPGNTPYAGPTMLGNAEPQKPKDAWATPEPLKPGEKVVRPGARVKIGG